MNRDFRKWLACAVAVTIAVYNAPYSVEALEVIKDSVQLDSATSLEWEQNVDVPQTEDDASDEVVEDMPTEANAGTFIVSGTKDIDWSYENNILTIKAGTNDITIKGTSDKPDTEDIEATDERIVVASGFKGIINLNEVNIKTSAGAPFLINDEASPTIKIKEGTSSSFITDSQTNAGIELNGENANITINEKEGEWGSLTAMLSNQIAQGAGIGSGNGVNCGTITIKGGVVEATSFNGAGIGLGSGGNSSCKGISIEGGAVTAKSQQGAGIGSGNGVNCGTITIKGGVVEATSSNGAGIGSGSGRDSSCTGISIEGGNVTANSDSGAGIGSGTLASCKAITISGGNVTAISKHQSAGIGSGAGASCGAITISGGNVIATSEIQGSGIGLGHTAKYEDITITGGTVTATGGDPLIEDNKPGIESGSSVIISGGSVKSIELKGGESISPDPKNKKENGENVYLVKLDKQGDFKEGDIVKVVGQTEKETQIDKDYKVASNHPNDNSFYLYMPAGTYTITTHKGVYDVTVDNNGMVQKKSPTPDPNNMAVTNTNIGIIVDVSAYSSEYGPVMCSLDEKNWYEENIVGEKRQVTLPSKASGSQKIYIKYKGNNDSYLESNSSNKTFEMGTITVNGRITYTGDAITEKDIVGSKSGNGGVTLEYSHKDGDSWNNTPPIDVGSYKVKATLAATDEYTGAIVEQAFEITQATNRWKQELKIENSTYGEKFNEPTAEAQFGDVKFTYSTSENEGYTENPPTEAGTHYVKAEVIGTNNFTGLESDPVEFEISKATDTWTTKFNIEDSVYGEKLNITKGATGTGRKVKYYYSKDNKNWTEGLPPNNLDAGTYYAKAVVEENENYKELKSEITFTISQATSSIEFKNGAKFDKIYDGKAVAITDSDIEKSGSTGAVTFTFEKKVDGNWFKPEVQEAPSEVGTYRVKASLMGDNNHTSAESQYLEFTIYAKAPEVTEDDKNIDTSTDRIEINTETENKGVYLYCTDSKDVPRPPKTSTLSLESVEVGVNTWQEVTGSKIIFTGLNSNTTYHVWKYDNAKPEGEKLTYEYSIKTDSPSTPSIPSKPEEKPGTGVDVEVVDKIAGETRYDTSVSISQKVYPSKSEKVYLVSGEKFPDALSSAALTGKGDGPILLINDKNIDKILSEIDRLDAKEIVFIGGNSISDANEAKIHKFAKENSSVVKSIVGKDRYETAVKVAEETIAKYGNKGKVIIADGRNYPDAVSIASYAAKEGIPVILVNGNKVPDVVKNFLNKYKINSAIIVGGDKAVGKDVEKLFKSVDRVAGADRYDTSKKIAEKFFAGSKTVFVASGESFADSLSVSYYAGAKNAPILLTKANSLDNDTKEYLEKNKNKDYIIVGGDKAINPDLFK